MRKLIPFSAVATALALSLAACSDPSSTSAEQSGTGSTAGESTERFDPLSIEVVPDIAAMVPESLKETGQLRNGASTDYAPGEFREDGKPVGYDIEIVQALGQVMGLEGTTQHAEFATIIPALGSKFDIGVSSFTITPERLEIVNMVSYIEAGSAFAVQTGNPKNFNPEDPCGTTIGVQTGTYQQELATAMSDGCVEEGKEPIEVMPLDLQTDVTLKVTGGLWDATFADSPVIGYAVANSKGKLEQIGEVIESEPQGVAIAKTDEQLTVAIQAAMQHLMDEGYLEAILANFGAEDSALSQARINPTN